MKIDFLIWMLLFPLLIVVVDYISAKTREITKEQKKIYSSDVEAYSSLVYVLIWFYVGYLLY